MPDTLISGFQGPELQKEKKKQPAVQASQSVELCYGSPNTARDGKFYCTSDDSMAPASVPRFYTLTCIHWRNHCFPLVASEYLL